MVSALISKTFHDLGKKKARSFFTILTIMLGVIGMALFAVNPLAEASIDEELSRQDLYNLRFSLPDIELNETVREQLLNIENVQGVEYQYIFSSEIVIDNGREDVKFVGIENIDDMVVDRIILDSGSIPSEGETLTDRWNMKNDVYGGKEGSNLKVIDFDESMIELSISGTGSSLAHREGSYDSSSTAFFYSDISTVHSLSASDGINMISFDLRSTGDEDLEIAIESIWEVLSRIPGIESLDQTPEIRKEGEWPGGDFLEMWMTIMYVLTLVAIVCSVFFIYNTMNTMISEQRREVGMMKAIGATRVKIFRSFLTTSLIMGMIGSLLGTMVGTFLTYVLLRYFGGLLGFEISSFLHLPTMVMGMVSGISIVVISSLSPIIKAIRVRTREGMEETGISAGYRRGLIDRLLMRTGWLPRTMQIGLRNISRRKGRSAATVMQVALAVGVFLGLVSVGFSLGEELTDTIDNLDYDIVLTSSDPGETINSSLYFEITSTEGVRNAEPYVQTRFTMGGDEVHVMGYPYDTSVKIHENTMVEGTWFSEDEENENVAVVGKQLANQYSISLSDAVEVMTPTGPAVIDVVGIDSDFYYMGMILYMPLSTTQSLFGDGGNVTGFHISIDEGSREEVDRVAADLEDTMRDSGTDVETDKKYRIIQGAVSQNRSIINMMTATSALIILISLVGLTSNLTMNILDRTREIGVMRCIGSVASSIRTMFTTEIITLSIFGWALGIPIGYLLARSISMLVDSMLQWKITIIYPPIYIVMGFFMVIIGAFLVAQIPILRATRIRPGDALRYQ